MHIMLLADAIDNQNAGVHHYLKNLIVALLAIDKNNKYSFIHNKKSPFFQDKNEYIIPQSKGPGSETIRRFYKIPKLIKHINPDAVWQPCHIGPFNVPKHVKRIVTIHDLTPILYPQFHTYRGKIIHRLLLGKTIKNADLILTPSKKTKKDILKRYETNAKIVDIYLGVNKITDEDTAKIPRIKTKPYILYLGTIEPRKNLEFLIDTYLETEIPQNLIIAGAKGWKNKRIFKKAKHPKITVLTNISESKKAELYRNADAFVYPSFYEGFGLPPLEAMSYNIPVICSNGGSLSELYKDHALMFDPNDKESLASYLKNFNKAPKSKQFANKFTWEKTAQQTLKAFNKLNT